ncbi:MAG: hypothetical protein EBS91_00095 [Betaproteobacteria bacterium]|nr:hypothetical protein [Betaproteobacteria bacterium]NCA23036.1 hypothetical protein [Betaproteobacteria bacterium]
MPKKKKPKRKVPQNERRIWMQDVVVRKRNARNALLSVLIDDDSIFTIIFRENPEDGSLWVEVSEDANPDTAIGNVYPEYFDDNE